MAAQAVVKLFDDGVTRKTVVQPDTAAFIKAAQPLHNDAAAGAGWTKEQYDRLQAIK